MTTERSRTVIEIPYTRSGQFDTVYKKRNYRKIIFTISITSVLTTTRFEDIPILFSDYIGFVYISSRFTNYRRNVFALNNPPPIVSSKCRYSREYGGRRGCSVFQKNVNLHGNILRNHASVARSGRPLSPRMTVKLVMVATARASPVYRGRGSRDPQPRPCERRPR